MAASRHKQQLLQLRRRLVENLVIRPPYDEQLRHVFFWKEWAHLHEDLELMAVDGAQVLSSTHLEEGSENFATAVDFCCGNIEDHTYLSPELRAVQAKYR